MWIDVNRIHERCFMPIYTYRCENCGFQFEKKQKFSDAPLTRCPECEKKELRKVYTPVGIVFKGSGFYATDNRSPSGASRSAGQHSEEKAASSSNGDSSDSAASSDSKTSPKKDTAASAASKEKSD